MSIRTIGEVIGMVVLLAMLGLYGHEQIVKWKDNLQATTRAEVLKQADKEKQNELSVVREKSNRDSAAKDAEIVAAKKSIADMAAFVNRTVPQAPKPILVIGSPTTTTLQTGDTVIPAVSAPVYFQSFADGNKCLTTSLPSCQAELNIQTTRIEGLQKQASEWETSSKGGTVWKRVWRVAKPLACAAGASGVASLAHASPAVVTGSGFTGGAMCAIF